MRNKYFRGGLSPAEAPVANRNLALSPPAALIFGAMLVRHAVPADVPAMMTIAAQAAAAAHWERNTYDRIFDPAQRGPARLALVIEEDSAVPAAASADKPLVGFLVALCTGPDWEIENLAVLGAAQQRGLGVRLLNELVDRGRAAGAEALFLEVRESNRAARAFYKKQGFVESGRRPGYYRDPPEDALLYHFRLVPEEKIL